MWGSLALVSRPLAADRISQLINRVKHHRAHNEDKTTSSELAIAFTHTYLSNRSHYLWPAEAKRGRGSCHWPDQA